MTDNPEHIKNIILHKFQETTRLQDDENPIPSPRQKNENDLLPPFSITEVSKALNKLKAGKAAGPDDIPNELLKALGPKGTLAITRLLNNILQGVMPIPHTWNNTRVKLIYKGKGKDKQSIDSYRPIALLSSIYKLHTSLLKTRLEHFLESSGALGDMQYGFRKNRNSSDCHFIISQLLEISKKKEIPIFLALLDIQGAYDNVNRKTLWKRLESLKVPLNLIIHLEKIYENTTSTYVWNEIVTPPVQNTKGVRQGCPLSTTLFITYMKRLEDLLNQNNKGFTFGLDTPQLPNTTCNGIMFADDITVLASNPADLSSQLETANSFALESDLTFCEKKSGIMLFNEVSPTDHSFKINNKEIPIVKEANLLGITITSSNSSFYSETDSILITKAKKYKGIIKNSSRNSFNKSVVSRTLWKQVATPSLTYINDIICYNPDTLKELDKQQIDVGKYALGANYITPHISIEGEMGWSSFETREARSKIAYRGKMLRASADHMTKKLFQYTSLSKNLTSWQKRTLKLMNKYKTQNNLNIHNNKEKWNKNTKLHVNTTNEVEWHKKVLNKASLSFYSSKSKPKWDYIYDNSLGSDLLLQARTGSLPTSAREATILGGSPACKLCGAAQADVTHILTACPLFQANRNRIRSLDNYQTNNNDELTTRWLGLSTTNQFTNDLCQLTKDLLQDWWKLAKNRQPYWRR